MVRWVLRLVLLAAWPGWLVAAPVNDAFAARAVLTGTNISLTATNNGATAETWEPFHAGEIPQASVWWRWTAPVSGSVTVSTAGSDFDTLLAVYTGSVLSDLVTVVESDDSGPGLSSTVRFTAMAGVVYQLAVDGFDGAMGRIWLRLGQGVAPANDAFAAAPELRNDDGVLAGNELATKEAGEPAHAGNAGGRSVWWRWTAPVAGTMSVNTTNSSINTVLAVYRGATPSNLTLVAANDDALGGVQSAVLFPTTAGETYRIAVDGFNGASGSIRLRGLFAPDPISAPPINDAFPNATPWAGTNVVQYGTTLLGSLEAGEPVHALNGGGRSVWFRWTAPAAGPVTVTTAGGDFDTILAVYTGTSVAGLTEVDANDDVGPGRRDSRVTWQATPGTTYRIALDGYRSVVGTTTNVESGFYRIELAHAATLTAPFILDGPTNVATPAGGVASFSVTALGTPPLRYQWSVDGRAIAGATNATLVISNVQPGSAGSYRVVVTNNLGTATSGAGVLTVLPADGAFSWVTYPWKSAGSSGSFGSSLAVDGQGNTYLAGSYYGALALGPTNLTSVNGTFGASYDGFLARFSPDGRLAWIRKFGGTGEDYARGVAVLPSGDVFVTGTFNGSAQFSPTNNVSAGAGDHGFVACYQTNGTLRWLRTETTGPATRANAIGVSPWGDVYVAGRYEGTVNFGGWILSSTGSGDIFLVRYRATDGVVQWATSAGNSSAGDAALAVAVWPGASANESAVHISGYIQGQTYFSGVTTGGEWVMPIGGEPWEGYVARYGRSGDLQWARGVGGGGSESVHALVVDANGAATCGGYFSGPLEIGLTNVYSVGNLDAFLVQFSPQGAVNWVRDIGGTQFDDLNGLAVDGRNNLWLSGRFRGTAGFSGTNLTSAGDFDLFRALYDNAGRRMEVTRVGGAGWESAGGIVVGPDGAVFQTGEFEDPASFGAIQINASLTSGGQFFLARGPSNSPVMAPVIWQQPDSHEIDAGQTVTFEVRFSGGAANLQWTRDGVAIPGANQSRLTIPSATVADAGQYQLIIATEGGTVASSPAYLQVLDVDVWISINSPTFDEQGNVAVEMYAYATNVRGQDSELAIFEGDRLLFVRPFTTRSYTMGFVWSEPPLGSHCLRAVVVERPDGVARTVSSGTDCFTISPAGALGFYRIDVLTAPTVPNPFGGTSVYGSVQVQNLTGRTSAPLRVRIQRNRSYFYLTSEPPGGAVDPQEEFLPWIVEHPGLADGSLLNVSIGSSFCPPWEETFGGGYQYHIWAVLEEKVGGRWVFADRTKLFSSIIRKWFPFNDGALGIDPLPTTNIYAFLVSLDIVAPTNLVEGRQVQLAAVGTLNDGATGLVNAAWSASIPGLTPEGLFQVPWVTTGQTVSLSASYQRRTTKSAARVLNIPDLGDPPTIVVPPSAQVGAIGGSASYGVEAAGTGPLGYVWWFDGTAGTNALTWASGPTLTLTNLQAAQTGLYRVVVTNILGAVTSPPVALTLVAPALLSAPERIEGNQLRLVIHGRAGDRWRILSSANLVDWVHVTELTLSGPSAEYWDPGVSSFSRRFFRLEALPPP